MTEACALLQQQSRDIVLHIYLMMTIFHQTLYMKLRTLSKKDLDICSSVSYGMESHMSQTKHSL